MERRYHEPPAPDTPIVVSCRHCFTPNVLELDHLEVTEGRAWARCQTCEDWYLVRWDDAVAVGAAKPPNAIDVAD